MTQKRRIFELLGKSDVLEVEPGFLVQNRAIYGIDGDGDDLAVSLSWRDHADDEWVADFSEDSLAQARLSRGKIRLVDTVGETVVVKPYRCVPA